MMIMMIVVWALITVAVVVAFAGWSREESQPYSAPEILRQRYARGEINKKEFESTTGDLS